MGIIKAAAMIIGGVAATKVWSDIVIGIRKDYKEFNKNYDAYKQHVLDIYKDDPDIRSAFDGRTSITTEKGLLFLRYMIEKTSGKDSSFTQDVEIQKDDNVSTMEDNKEKVEENGEEPVDDESLSCSGQCESCTTCGADKAFNDDPVNK